MIENARPLRGYSDFDLELHAREVPGWGPGSRLNRKDKDIMSAGLPDEVMVAIYESIDAPACPYVSGVFDCENIARWYAAHVAELWGRLVKRHAIAEPMLLAQGVVCGEIPVGVQPAGNHAACFFFNDKGVYRMYEPQSLYLLDAADVARTVSTWELEYH